MSWEWVVLILGVVSLVCLLFAWVSWTNVKIEKFKATPKTLPDMLRATERDPDGIE